MAGGAVQTNQISAWLTSLIKTFDKPSISSVASPTPHLYSCNNIAKADSGASFHFFKPEHRKAMTNIQKLQNGPSATLPNNTVIQASCQGLLPFPSLSTNAQTALIYPDLNNESLLSIGQFCDDDCWALFTKKNVYIIKDDAVILNGIRNRTDGLWDIQLPDNTSLHQQNGVTKNNMNYIITKDKSKTELAQYLLATAYSPAISTFEYAIDNGNFVTWPGITELNFKKLIVTMIPIEKGHMDQERKISDQQHCRRKKTISFLCKHKQKSMNYLR